MDLYLYLYLYPNWILSVLIVNRFTGSRPEIKPPAIALIDQFRNWSVFTSIGGLIGRKEIDLLPLYWFDSKYFRAAGACFFTSSKKYLTIFLSESAIEPIIVTISQFGRSGFLSSSSS